MKNPYLLFRGLLSILTLLLFTTCQKQKLPPKTQEGKNTFGCKVNGKAWIPDGGPGFQGAHVVQDVYPELE